MSDEYHSDYPTVPIGGGNPYHACASCGVSDPEINGRLEGHREECEWRIAKERELELRLPRMEDIERQNRDPFVEEVIRAVQEGADAARRRIDAEMARNPEFARAIMIISSLNQTVRPMAYDKLSDTYASEDGWRLAREEGQTPNGNELNGAWVLRNRDGVFIDFSQHRHDLAGRYKFKLG